MSAGHQNSLAKLIAPVLAFLAGLFLFIAGVGSGVWFMSNFEIVPKDDLARVAPQELDVSQAQPSLGQVASQQSPEFEAATPLTTEAVPHAGTFTFRFTPGENLKYSLKANIDGKGLELLTAEPVSLEMDSAFNLRTKQVDRQGNGDLELAFAHANLAGNFMGSAFEMQQDRNGAVVTMNGETMVNSQGNAAGIAGIPQLEFFDQAISMKIAPNGEVLSVSGGSGLEGLTQQLPLLTDLEFPSGEMVHGTQWETQVSLPVPGFGIPVNARIMNTFTGYQRLGARLCAVIEQEISAAQMNGTVQMPESVLGSAMGLTMPQFDLSGANQVFFDVENGQLIHSEMALQLGMDLGKALGPAGAAISQLGAGLGDLLSDLPEFEHLAPETGSKQEKQDLLNLDLDIHSTVSLVETGVEPIK